MPLVDRQRAYRVESIYRPGSISDEHANQTGNCLPKSAAQGATIIAGPGSPAPVRIWRT